MIYGLFKDEAYPLGSGSESLPGLCSSFDAELAALHLAVTMFREIIRQAGDGPVREGWRLGKRMQPWKRKQSCVAV